MSRIKLMRWALILQPYRIVTVMQNVCGLYNVTIFTFTSVERCGPEKPCVALCT